MMKRMVAGGKGFWAAIALVLLLAVTGHAEAASKVPHFALPSAVDGKLVDVDSLRGKVLLINFFATWCPPCRQEIPSFVRLQEELGPKGFSFVGLSLDENSGMVVKLINRLGINYPVVLADSQVTHDFGNIVGVPTSFLVDRSGTIVKRYTGYIDHNTLQRDLAAVLN